MQRLLTVVVAMVALVAGCSANGGNPPVSTDATLAKEIAIGPLDDCPPVFGSHCESVWPWFAFQAPAKTATGVKNDLQSKWFLAAKDGKGVDVAPINRRDGVSPVTPVVILPPKPIDPKVLADETKPVGSLAADSATVMVDADTGKRIRHLAELDLTSTDDSRRALILRPYAPLGFGKRIVVGLSTKLLGKDGQPMPRAPAFASLVTGTAKETSAFGRVDRHFAVWKQDLIALEKAGLPRVDQVAAWHFTTASAAWVTGPAVDLRSKFIDKVGSDGLGLKIETIEVDPEFVAALPALMATPLPAGATVIVAKMHPDIALRIRGQFELPNAMSKGQDADSLLNWSGDQPVVALQPQNQWRPFALLAGPLALQAKVAPPLTLYGHGFLRQICLDFCITSGVADPASHFFHAAGAVAVGTDWWGLSQPELGIALGISGDMSKAPQLTEKLLHGALSYIALSRAIQHKVSDDPRFAVLVPLEKKPRPLTDGKQGLRYNGNSLGGIQGTTMAALHPQVERAVLHVAGGVWSTMMNRSSNFAAFLTIVGASYPDPFDQQVAFALMQSHWDLADPVHFAPLVVSQPLAGSVANRKALWPISWGDSQVPQLASSMLARSSGAVLLGPPVSEWLDVPVATEQPFGGNAAFIQWDSLRGGHPAGNAPPQSDNMSHYAPRWMPEYNQMIGRFLYGDGKVEQRYCLARDTDGVLPCTIKQDIPEKAKDMPALPKLPPADFKAN